MTINQLALSEYLLSCYLDSGYIADNKIVRIRAQKLKEVVAIDFSTLFTGNRTVLICNCRYTCCRKNIKGFDSLPVLIQEFNLKLNALASEISKFLLKID